MFRKTLLAAAAVALIASPTFAKDLNVNAGGGKGLVVVDVSALDQSKIDLLKDANIEILNDNTVQVPINVAATICDVEVNAIAKANDQGNKSCTATAAGVEKLSG